jgi:hypothetical protein
MSMNHKERSLRAPGREPLDRLAYGDTPWGETRRLAAEEGRAFGWSGVAPFEQMHPVRGHEYTLGWRRTPTGSGTSRIG